jgi:glycosyltransferase involved in cell wall biosynthesis
MTSDACVTAGPEAAREALRVTVVTETFPPEINGVAMTLGRLVGALRAGNDVQLIRPRQGPYDAPASVPGLEELLVPGVAIPGYRQLRVGLPAAHAVERLWARRPPDIVHIATEGPLGWSVLRAARRLGLPVVSGFHTNFHRYSAHYGAGFLNRPIMGYLRRFHNATLATMVPTEALRQELASQGFRNLRVVARGVDTRLFNPARRDQRLRAQWGVTGEEPVALHVGRLAPEKNLSLVVRAFEAMRARVPASKLVWVGDGPQRATLARRFPHHVFAGARSGEDLAAHYASADLFIFASMTETFGNVTLEAMSSGLAVLAYDYAAARQHVIPGRSGLLAPFGDAAAFVRIAEAMIGSPERVAGMRTAARASAESADWHTVFDDYHSVLRWALGAFRAPGGRARIAS